MQNESLLVVGSGLTVNGAELTSELRMTETDLELDVSSHDAANNSAGTRIELRSEDGRIVAMASVLRAERAASARDLGMPVAMLRTSAIITDLSVEDPAGPALSALLYAAARRARILDRANILLRGSVPLAQQAGAILRLAPCSDQLSTVSTQRVDLAVHYASAALDAADQPVAAKLRAQEVAETARRWLSNGREWGLFRAVHARTLTRRQYVYALSNIYQFVRHTTRILARCIAHSDTTEMRSHFIHHLNGEVNHELIIERDLRNMGEDVEYVCQHMAPNGPTQEFMAIQEALIGYYEDPVQLMASPMAAEGVTAHLDQAFVDNLHACMREWGLKTPERASKFFVSHMSTDGGPDGHWETTVNFLARCLDDETKHQFFLRSMRNSMRGTQRLYDSFVDDIPSWTAGPAAKSTGTNREAQA